MSEQSTLICAPPSTVHAVGREFILAGEAILTVDNGRGTHYTYRVQKVEASDRWPAAWFVKLLIGPDNTHDYAYLGKLDPGQGTLQLTRKSIHPEDAQSVRVFRWALGLVWAGKPFPAGYSIHHEGYCGRCGRQLTTPESVSRGFGPDCWEMLHAW
jgi:hypothetical protein